MGSFGKNAIAAGLANSGQHGANAATLAAVSTFQGAISGGTWLATGAVVVDKTIKAVQASILDKLGRGGSPAGKWDTERRIRGQGIKNSIIGAFKSASAWLESWIPKSNQGSMSPRLAPIPAHKKPEAEPEAKPDKPNWGLAKFQRPSWGPRWCADSRGIIECARGLSVAELEIGESI